ncbi:MAG: glutamate 5-kinase [Clostridiales Family XIII bacterium]|jgi:glutamate 5-kinase|nr:glutamate 5-kinase [Clostridiales Family XIII bacterium]
MERIAEILNASRKIVLKIGSNVLSDGDGRVDQQNVKNIAEQVHFLMDRGKQVLIVSSGAGICGVGAINKWARRDDINYKQALCAIGQVELMLGYKKFLNERRIHVAQMLLTNEDFSDNNRILHIRNTLFTLLDEGVVPIINENDSVSVEEIEMGDNDMLAARTAELWDADVLVLMSDIDGIYDKSPKEYEDARLIREVYDLGELESSIDMGPKSSFGTGGIGSKIEAARLMGRYSIPTILLNGRNGGALMRALSERIDATLFHGAALSSTR